MEAIIEGNTAREVTEEKYEFASDEEVMKVSRRLIEENMKAYKALANA